MKHPSTHTNLNILFVDDNATARRLFKQFLEKQGYRVTGAIDGKEAFRLFSSETKFDHVICDFDLKSDLNGIDVLTEFERLRPGKGKILITALASDCVDDSAKKLGAACIVKPVNLQSLLTCIRNFTT